MAALAERVPGSVVAWKHTGAQGRGARVVPLLETVRTGVLKAITDYFLAYLINILLVACHALTKTRDPMVTHAHMPSDGATWSYNAAVYESIPTLLDRSQIGRRLIQSERPIGLGRTHLKGTGLGVQYSNLPLPSARRM